MAGAAQLDAKLQARDLAHPGNGWDVAGYAWSDVFDQWDRRYE